MKKLLWIGLLGLWSNAAHATPADCLLVVGGKTYIKGVCEFSPRGGGNFQISGKDYFAQLNINSEENGGKNTGSVNWNGEPGSAHAQGPGMEVRRKGVCWEGPSVKICARDLGKAELAKFESNRPAGKMIELMEPGYPHVFPRGYRVQAGVELVIGQKYGPRGELPKFFQAGEDNIVIDRHPDLCVDAKPAKQPGQSRLVLENCKQVSIKWKLQPEGTICSTSGNLCWILPDIDKDAEFWPIQVMAGACSPNTPHFSLSTGD